MRAVCALLLLLISISINIIYYVLCCNTHVMRIVVIHAAYYIVSIRLLSLEMELPGKTLTVL